MEEVINFSENAQEVLKRKIISDEAILALVICLSHLLYIKGEVSISDLAEQVLVRRKVAIRNKANRIIRYEYRDDQSIGRAKVERILEKLEFCTLITITENHPSKLINLTEMGQIIILPIVKQYHLNGKDDK